MARGIKLFRVLGIQISIDYTWFIVFVFFAWTLAYGYFPYSTPGLSAVQYAAMGFTASLSLFACVLIHELAHSYTSNRLGLEIKEITLFIFGGVAQLTKEPEDPRDELKIAIAGPLSSAVLAVMFWGASKFVTSEAHLALNSILSYLALINIVLVIFNMIPGFPLDGGRVLRAVWWWKTGDVGKATRMTSRIGKGFALFLIITGFLRIMTGNFIGGIWSVLIGVFLQQAAESGLRQLVLKKALEGMKVRDLMTREVITIPGGLSLAEAVEEYFFKKHFVSFPVVSDGRIEGLLTLNNVRMVNKEAWDTTLVRDAMHRLSPEDILSPEEDAQSVLMKMTSDNLGRFPVVKDGALVGIVTRRDVMKMLEFKSELQR